MQFYLVQYDFAIDIAVTCRPLAFKIEIFNRQHEMIHNREKHVFVPICPLACLENHMPVTSRNVLQTLPVAAARDSSDDVVYTGRFQFCASHHVWP